MLQGFIKKTPIRSAQGMTLIEVIIATLIFAIVSLSASAALVPSLNVMKHSNQLAELNTLLNTLSAEISQNISCSLPLPVVADSSLSCFSNGNQTTYAAASGLLTKAINGAAPTNILPPTYYQGKTIGISFSPPDAHNVYTFTLQIYNAQGGLLTERTFSAKPTIIPNP